jgi:allantoicase
MTDFTALPDLASHRLGGGVVWANDEFFAAADSLVDPAPPTFQPNSFGPKGQIYDGWETRRRREPGHDHAFVRLGAPGVVRGVVIDTAYFTGNYPPYASVEGCGVDGYPSPAELSAVEWFPLLSQVPLAGDARNAFTVDGQQRVTHVRLSIYPDGGVARLRVHGEVVPDPRLLGLTPVDLAAIEHGGRVVECSNMFYGSPNNLLMPGLAGTMGEGWETARRRDAGNDWVLVRLAVPGRVRLAELDTSHFKGNAPGHAALRAVDARVGGFDDADAWFDLLPHTRLQPDTRHRFGVPSAPEATHVRLDVYPDGGMARLRLFGVPAEGEIAELALLWFNLLPPAQALAALADLAPDDARRLVDSRPVSATGLLPRLWT